MDAKTWIALLTGGGITALFGLVATLLSRQTSKEANNTAANKLAHEIEEDQRKAAQAEREEDRKWREEHRHDLEECHKREDILQGQVDMLRAQMDALRKERDDERAAHQRRVLLCLRCGEPCQRRGGEAENGPTTAA